MSLPAGDTVLVRSFHPDDQDAVAELYLSGRDDNLHLPVAGLSYQAFVNDRLKPDGDMRNIQRDFMELYGEKGHFWVAVLNDEIVGIVGAKPGDKYSSSHVELVRLFVTPRYRQLGIAKKLVMALEAWAASVGYTHVYLGTLVLLVESNLFYPKCGYTIREVYEFDISEYAGLAEPTMAVSNYYEKEIQI